MGRGAGVDPLAADTEAIELHLAELRSQGRHPASMARSTTAPCGLFRFLVGEGDIERRPHRRPALAPHPPSAAQGPRRGPGARCCSTRSSGTEPADLRDRALLEVLYGTGARISEVVGLSLTDLQGDDGLLRVFGKGAKERLVPLGGPARMALDRWLSPAGRPRLAPSRWARRQRRRGGVPQFPRGADSAGRGPGPSCTTGPSGSDSGDVVSPHVLRHSCASHMLAHGADIRVVQELLGHVSIATTQIYTRLSQDHLRASYAQAHPRATAPQLK